MNKRIIPLAALAAAGIAGSGAPAKAALMLSADESWAAPLGHRVQQSTAAQFLMRIAGNSLTHRPLVELAV